MNEEEKPTLADMIPPVIYPLPVGKPIQQN